VQSFGLEVHAVITTATTTVTTLDPAETNRLRLALLRVVRNIRSHAIETVTPSQVAVLSTLVRHGPSTVGQIADYERVKPPSASRIVTALEEQGLVGRTPDPDDRRSATIHLTAEGERYLSVVKEAQTSWLGDRISELREDEIEILRAAIPTLERLLGPDE
jgi:DNA-binding MarR family transcriptional regulator